MKNNELEVNTGESGILIAQLAEHQASNLRVQVPSPCSGINTGESCYVNKDAENCIDCKALY